MDQVYSLTLLASLVSGTVALGTALWGRLHPEREAAGLAGPAAVIAWVSLAVSVAVHVVWGHAPGSPSALPPLAFLREHVSFVVAAVVPAAALLARARAVKASPSAGA